MTKHTVSGITTDDEAGQLGLVLAESADRRLLAPRRRGLASAVVDIARSSWSSPTNGGFVGARSVRTSDADSHRLSSTGQAALRGATSSPAGTSGSGTPGSLSGDGRGTPRSHSEGSRTLHTLSSGAHAKRLSMPLAASSPAQPQPQNATSRLNPQHPHSAHSPASAKGGGHGCSGPVVDSGPRWPRDDLRLQAAVRAWWDWLPKTLLPSRRGQQLVRGAISLQDSDSRLSVVSTSRGPSADGTRAEASLQQEGEEQQAGGVPEKGRGAGGQGERTAAAEGGEYGASLDSTECGGGDDGALDQATYSALVLAIASVLLPRFAVPSDIAYDPSDDWSYDSGGLPYMDYDHFYDVLLDLADAWSAESDADGQARLLETLLRDAQKRLGPAEGPFPDEAATDSVATVETPATSTPTTPRLSAPTVTFRQLLHTFRDRLQQSGTAAAAAAAAATAAHTTSPPGGSEEPATPTRSQPFLQLTLRPDTPAAATSPTGALASEPSTPAPDPRLPSSPPHGLTARSGSPSSYNSTYTTSPGETSLPSPSSLSPVLLAQHTSGSHTYPHTHLRLSVNEPTGAVGGGSGVGHGGLLGYGLGGSGGPPHPAVSVVGQSSAPYLVIQPPHPHPMSQLQRATSPSMQRAGFQTGAPHPSQLTLWSQSPPVVLPNNSCSPRTRREGPFKLPHYSPVDVSGIRSTLGDYLREGPRRPNPATLEQWRRSRASARRGQRQSGSARANSPSGRESRPLTPTCLPLQPQLLEGESGESGVLMYEQYMHELAARYLARQEEVLVATSARAAAAAAQLLASATGAPQPPAQPMLETMVTGDGALTPGFDGGGAGTSQMISCHGGAMESSSPVPHGLTFSPLTSPRDTQNGDSGFGLMRGTSPPPVLVPPPPLPPLLAPTIDIQAAMMEQMQPVCVVGHAMPVESPNNGGAGGVSPTGGPRTSWSKMSVRRRSNATTVTTVTASGSRPQSPSGPACNLSTSPRVVALASVEGGHSGSGRGLPFSVQFSPPGAVDMALPSHPDEDQQLPETAAANSATQSQSQAQAQAQAQAQVVVAFAAAACRLADPNVHALLLPPHVYGNGAAGPRHLSRRLSGGLSARGTAPSSGQRSRPMTAAAGTAAAGQQSAVGAAVERFAPYMGPAAAAALNYLRPHIAPGGGDDSSDATRPSGPAAAWDSTPVGNSNGDSASGGHHNPPSCSSPLPNSWAEQQQQLRYPSDSPVHTPASATGAAALLGGAVKRRLATTRTSATATTINSWSVATAPGPPPHSSQAPGGIFEPPGQRPQPHGQPQLYSHAHNQQHAHAAYAEHPAAQGAVSAAHVGMGATPAGANMAGVEGGGGGGYMMHGDGSGGNTSSGGGVGIGAVGSRLQTGSSTYGSGLGLAQTPRSSLLPCGSTSRRSSNTSGGNGGTCGAAGVGGRRFCGGPAASVSGNGAGVVMPHGSMSVKLRNFYAGSPNSMVTHVSAPAYNTAPVGNGSGGVDELETGILTSPRALSASEAAAREGSMSIANGASRATTVLNVPPGSRRAISASLSASHSARPRHVSASGPALVDQGTAMARSAWTGVPGGSSGVIAVRSPMRIRSSDPVGFSDAVTATRMNVAIMADELVQRQAEQRAQARMLRERTLHLRPSTAKARTSSPQSFGAFMAAARESVSMGYDVTRG